MSEFFKAAVKCDPRNADKAPMYVDQTQVLEEQFKHEQLVQQSMRTTLLLEEVERTFSVGQPTNVEYAVPPPYTPPAALAQDKDPADRRHGARQLLRNLEAKQAEEREATRRRKEELLHIESEEQAAAALQRKRKAAAVQRELQVEQRWKDMKEQELLEEESNVRAEQERKQTKRHPIDVFQERVARDLLADLQDWETKQASYQKQAQQPLEDQLQEDRDEVAKATKEARRRQEIDRQLRAAAEAEVDRELAADAVEGAPAPL